MSAEEINEAVGDGWHTVSHLPLETEYQIDSNKMGWLQFVRRAFM